MRFPAGKPVDYYQKRHWGVRDAELAHDVFDTVPTPAPNVLTAGLDWSLQDQVNELYFYVRACPGGVDTFTFTLDDGRPDAVAAAVFYDLVYTQFAKLAPAGLALYATLAEHQVHLVADEVVFREPSTAELRARRGPVPAPVHGAAIGGLVAYLLAAPADPRGWTDTFTFLDNQGQPDPAAAYRFAQTLRDHIHGADLQALLAVREQAHLVHVRLHATPIPA